MKFRAWDTENKKMLNWEVYLAFAFRAVSPVFPVLYFELPACGVFDDVSFVYFGATGIQASLRQGLGMGED